MGKKITLICLLLLSSSIDAQEKKFPVLTGPYLGQKPSGRIPEIFAPGIISLGYHEHRIAVSPAGDEIYYSISGMDYSKSQIMFTKTVNGIWTIPAMASFSNIGINLHPAFSNDGNRLYFSSNRPCGKTNGLVNDFDIWFVERVGNVWSEPLRVSNKINTDDNEASPSLMEDGTIYFERIASNHKGEMDVWLSHFKNGEYQRSERVPAPVNSNYSDLGPFISPKGDYLLFYSNRPGTIGKSDLYITFKNNLG